MSVRKTAATVGSAGVIAATLAITPAWEGYDMVAKRDMIGTGHPITYCIGQTDEFGKVKIGQRFTKEECDTLLAKSLPKYLNQVGPCVHVPVPVKAMAALVDASYNAGAPRVCRSPMVAKMNAGDVKGACEAFAGWIVHSDGQYRAGLANRRAMPKRAGDSRISERQDCLDGLSEPKAGWYTFDPNPPKPVPPPPAKPFWWEWIFKK